MVGAVRELPAAHSSGQAFAADPGGPKNIVPKIADTPAGPVVSFVAGIRKDADGAGEAWKKDRGRDRHGVMRQYGQPQTTLIPSPDPTKIPYIVVSPLLPVAHIGDIGAITYGGKTIYGIVADHGPKDALGEYSLAAAASFGENGNPTQDNGLRSGVTCTIIGGSRPQKLPATSKEIQDLGATLFEKAGLSPNSPNPPKTN
jgi:hypothetical protein